MKKKIIYLMLLTMGLTVTACANKGTEADKNVSQKEDTIISNEDTDSSTDETDVNESEQENSSQSIEETNSSSVETDTTESKKEDDSQSKEDENTTADKTDKNETQKVDNSKPKEDTNTTGDKADKKEPQKESNTKPKDEANTSGDKTDNKKPSKPDNSVKDKQAELKNIRDVVAAAYEDYLPSMLFDATQVKDLFGVEKSWYDAIVAEGPMISMHVDTFIAIHPTKGNLKKVQQALENYKDYLVNESMQYPMNVAKVQAASIFTVDGNVYFIMLGQIDDGIDDEAERLAAFEAQNQIAIDAISK